MAWGMAETGLAGRALGTRERLVIRETRSPWKGEGWGMTCSDSAFTRLGVDSGSVLKTERLGVWGVEADRGEGLRTSPLA